VLGFPADHASHPEYRLEWWYYTGNLATAEGRRFGYQLTFFRIGVNLVPSSASRWAVRDPFLAHLAVTDTNSAAVAKRLRQLPVRLTIPATVLLGKD